MSPAMIPPLAAALGPWLTGLVAFGFVVGLIMKAWQPLARNRVDRDAVLITQLSGRVVALETQLEEHVKRADAERQRLEDKIEAQRKDYEQRGEQDRVRYEYDLREARHRANGAFQSLKLLVALLEADEDTLSSRARKALDLVRQAIAEEEKRAAEERASIERVKLTLAAPAPVPA